MRGQKAETPIVARALRVLSATWWVCKVWRANSGGNISGHRCNSINLPDIMGFTDRGKILACEVKTHDGVLSQEQYDFLKTVADLSGYAAVYAPLVARGKEMFFVYPDIPEQFMPKKKSRKGAQSLPTSRDVKLTAKVEKIGTGRYCWRGAVVTDIGDLNGTSFWDESAEKVCASIRQRYGIEPEVQP